LAFGTFGPQQESSNLAFVPRFELGVELGKNLLNKLHVDGSGRVARLYAGATAYQELGTPWLLISVTYQLRVPFADEIAFRKLRNGTTELTLNQDTRQFLEIAPQVKVGNWFSLKPTYKRGALPPAFTYVDNEFSLAVQFAAKAVRK
jgi:hypothetical protein